MVSGSACCERTNSKDAKVTTREYGVDACGQPPEISDFMIPAGIYVKEPIGSVARAVRYWLRRSVFPLGPKSQHIVGRPVVGKDSSRPQSCLAASLSSSESQDAILILHLESEASFSGVLFESDIYFADLRPTFIGQSVQLKCKRGLQRLVFQTH